MCQLPSLSHHSCGLGEWTSITGLVIALVPLQALKMILPELADTLERVNRPLAVSLAKEPAAVALKLVSLRSIFANANILKLIERR